MLPISFPLIIPSVPLRKRNKNTTKTTRWKITLYRDILWWFDIDRFILKKVSLFTKFENSYISCLSGVYFTVVSQR